MATRCSLTFIYLLLLCLKQLHLMYWAPGVLLLQSQQCCWGGMLVMQNVREPVPCPAAPQAQHPVPPRAGAVCGILLPKEFGCRGCSHLSHHSPVGFRHSPALSQALSRATRVQQLCCLQDKSNSPCDGPEPCYWKQC